MLQHIIAISIVFLAFGYAVFSIIKNLSTKKASACGTCSGCGLKNIPVNKPDCDKALP